MELRSHFLHLSECYGLTEREIARRFDVAPSVVHYWLRRGGKAATTKRGRPRVTSKVDDEAIYRASISDPFKTAVDLKQELRLKCHIDSVRNRLKAKGLKCHIPALKPAVTEEHRMKRHAFASTHRHWDVAAWHRVVFSDEKIFRSSSRGVVRVYRPKRASDRFDEKYLVPSTNPVDKLPRFDIAVWMGFGGQGHVRQLHRIERHTLDAEYYVQRILPSVRAALRDEDVDIDSETGLEAPPRRLIFMQDLSSIHKSLKSRHWLHENNIRVLWDWPPKGPDLNPVENVWAMIVRRIEKRIRCPGGGGGGIDNADQLWEYIYDAFQSLENKVFDNLIASMPRRVRTVDTLRGGWTKY